MVSLSNIIQWIQCPPPPDTHTHKVGPSNLTCTCSTLHSKQHVTALHGLTWDFLRISSSYSGSSHTDLRWNQALSQNKINVGSLSLSWTARRYHQCRKFTLAKRKTLGLCAMVFHVGTEYIIISLTAYLQSLVSAQQLPWQLYHIWSLPPWWIYWIPQAVQLFIS